MKNIKLDNIKEEDINITQKSACIYWEYPEIYDKNKQDHIRIRLIHTRASDGIMVKFDAKRDGFVIYQPKWVVDERVWVEVFFAENFKFEEGTGLF